LLCRAATVVEFDYLPRPAGHVGHDEPDTRKQLILMPLDLGNHATRMVPTLCLIREALVEHLGLVRRASRGTGQQVADTGHKNVVRGDANGVLETLLLQYAVQRRDGKRRVTSEVLRNVAPPVSVDDR
jgi:hypothetical protein